jgi:hypothetical protein
VHKFLVAMTRPSLRKEVAVKPQTRWSDLTEFEFASPSVGSPVSEPDVGAMVVGSICFASIAQ